MAALVGVPHVQAQQSKKKEKPPTGQQWVTEADIPKSTLNCAAAAPAGYPGKACLVEIDRDAPVAPPTLVVPGGTTIYVKLTKARWDEIVGFNTVVAQTAGPNLLADALTSLASPLSALQVTQHAPFLGLVLPSEIDKSADLKKAEEDIQKQQKDMDDKLSNASKTVLAAGTQFSCLESYRRYNPAIVSCDSDGILTYGTAAQALSDAIDAANQAATLPLPSANLKMLDTSVTNFANSCSNFTDGSDERKTCIDSANQFQSAENRLDATLTAITTAQTALQAVVRQVTPRKSGVPSTDVFRITQPFMRTATVTVTGTEFVTNTATTVSTMTVNWQQTAFVLSTGVMGSGLANKTYSISNVIVNGVVQTDPASGKNLSKVVSNSLQPSMDFPAVFGSWTIPWLSRAKWEYRCPGHCAFLLSAGAALNLTGKTADLAIGPSFQISGVMLTPSLVWGRQTVLADGITDGYTSFGINPPSTLPTKMAWKKAFGIALTYSLPLP
jgi:hypothetical protein